MIKETGMINYLASAMIDGEWLLAVAKTVIVALGTGGAAWIVAFKKGQAQSGEVTLKEPMPELKTQRVYSPPTFHQHQELMRRVDALEKGTTAHREYVEGQFRDIRRESAEQFMTLMNAGETRKDAITDELHKEMGRIYERMNKLADLLK